MRHSEVKDLSMTTTLLTDSYVIPGYPAQLSRMTSHPDSPSPKMFQWIMKIWPILVQEMLELKSKVWPLQRKLNFNFNSTRKYVCFTQTMF